MIVIGIDPGLDGAIAVYDGAAIVAIHDMPTLALQRNRRNKREIDAHLLADLIEDAQPSHAYLEQSWARGKSMQHGGEAASFGFAFGKSYGICIGVLAALDVPMTLVPPQAWKRKLHVPSSKDAARARASEMMPEHAHFWARKKDDGRAESALIALYGSLIIQRDHF